MHSPNKYDFQAAATQAGNESTFDTELRMLRDVLQLLPTGITVQDERGDFLLVNDAATALLRMAAAAPGPSQLSDRCDTCLELLRSGRADAWASPRPPLLEYAPKLAGARVLDGRYGENLQSMAVPKDQAGRLAYISEFLEAAKASGLVQRAIERAGEHGMEVAPTLEPPVVTGTVPSATPGAPR